MSDSQTRRTSAEASDRPPLDHRLRRMVGRDPERVAPQRDAARAPVRPHVRGRVQPGGRPGRPPVRTRALRTGDPRLLLRAVRDLLGVDQLLVARVGLRQRRRVLPHRDHDPDARRARARARAPAVLPFSRRGRASRYQRRGRRLRDHAHRHGGTLAQGGSPRPRAPATGTRLCDDRVGRAGRLGDPRPHQCAASGRARALRRASPSSSSPRRCSSNEGTAALPGTPATSPNAMASS